MRKLLMRGVLVALIAGSIAFVSGQQAKAATDCATNVITTGTIAGSLNVPSGTFCYLRDATVTGSITVQPNGNLDAKGTVVGASVKATSPFGLGFTINTDGTTNRIGGSVTVNGTNGGGGYYLCNTVIGSGLSISDSAPGGGWAIGWRSACPSGANHIGGPTKVTNNHSDMDFDDNTFGGSVSATGNTHGGEFLSNVINGSLTVNNPLPCFTVAGNSVNGAQNVVC